MRGALFGDQIEAYKDVFVHKGEYKIADAQIRPAEEQWKRSDVELDFQMTFGRQTVIQRVNAESGPVQPEYLCIVSVPRVGDPDERYDVLGIVLYVEEHKQEIATVQNRQALVRETFLSDHSSEQPLTLSVWNDLTGSDCDALSSWAEKFTVVDFTSLRDTSHKADAKTFAAVQELLSTRHVELLSTRHVLMEVGPTMSLAKCNSLQWCLKQMVIEHAAGEGVSNHTATEGVNHAVDADEGVNHVADAEEDANHAVLLKWMEITPLFPLLRTEYCNSSFCPACS
ncbi:hypothetical protein SOVF_145830 [Spinacia oleracea]|nr:hypothetical protein SOVF_145830 [Spinacia oleracea]